MPKRSANRSLENLLKKLRLACKWIFHPLLTFGEIPANIFLTLMIIIILQEPKEARIFIVITNFCEK